MSMMRNYIIYGFIEVDLTQVRVVIAVVHVVNYDFLYIKEYNYYMA